MSRKNNNSHPVPVFLLAIFLVALVWSIKSIGHGKFDSDDPNSVHIPTIQPTVSLAVDDAPSKKMFRDYLQNQFENVEITNLNQDYQGFSKNINQIVTRIKTLNSFKVSEVVDGKEFAQGLYDYKNKLSYTLEIESGREEYNLGNFKYIKEKHDPKFIRLLSDKQLVDESIESQIYDVTSRLIVEEGLSGSETYFAQGQTKETKEYIYFENILTTLRVFHIIENKSDNSLTFKFDNNIEEGDGYYSQKFFDINKPVKLSLKFGEDFRIWPPMPQTSQDKINNIFEKFKTVNSIEYSQESGEEQKSSTEYKLDLKTNKAFVDHESIVNDPYLYEYGNYLLVHVGGIDYFDTEKAGKFKVKNENYKIKQELLDIQKSFYNALNNLSKTVDFNYRQETVETDGTNLTRYLFTYEEPESNSVNNAYTLILSIDANELIREVGGMRTDYGKINYKFKNYNTSLDIAMPSWANTAKFKTVQ